MNQASSGINLAWSEEFGFRFSEGEPDKMIVAKKIGNQRRKEQVFFMGLRWEEVGCLSKKARLRELWGIQLKGKLLSAVVHHAKPNFTRSCRRQIRFLEILFEYTFVLMREKPVDPQGLVQGGMGFFKWHTAKR